MSKVALSGNASGTGTFTIASPNSNTDRTLSLPDQTGTLLTGSGAISVNASAPVPSVSVDASGNVGIGTSSPAQALDVRGRIQVSNGTAGGQLGVDGGGLSISGIGSGPITFAANTFATNLARIDSTGARSTVIPSGSTLYPAFDCRAWVNFNGTGTVAIRASGNVTSITDNGTGDYTVNFTTAMADANYACACSAATTGSGSSTGASIGDVNTATSSARFRTFFGTTQYDCFNVGVAIFR